MRQLLVRFAADESAATAIEYALIGTLISVAIMASAGLVGNAINNLFIKSGNKVNAVADTLN